jgi:hypothetical protein
MRGQDFWDGLLVESQFSPVDFGFEFLTASRLLELARMSPSTAHQLRLAESPIATGDQGYLCLVALGDYCAFIREDDGSLKERVFEGNVRDYQGNTEVNRAIRDTLEQRRGGFLVAQQWRIYHLRIGKSQREDVDS